jgi:O-methyltransferase involved in polyketide biosynthesis
MNGQIQPEDPVLATMLIPLYGRMIAGRRFPEILRDPTAERICESVDYDFSGISQTYGSEYASLACLARAVKIEGRARSFMAKRPEGTIISLGSGLDDTFHRIDNGSMHWFNLDLPDAIAFRERFIRPTARCRNIAGSMFDPGWLDEVPPPQDGHVLLVAGGVFFYFEESRLKELFRKTSERFPHGELYFDVFSKKGTEIANRMLRRAGGVQAEMKFWVDKADTVKAWSSRIEEVECLPYFEKIRKDGRISMSTRFLMWGADFLKRTKFVSVRW